MTYLSPQAISAQHIANQKLSITHTISSTRICRGPCCNGRRRSIAQFFDKFGNPTKTICKLCRGGK